MKIATDTNIKANRAGSFGNNGYELFVQLKPGISYAQGGPPDQGHRMDRNQKYECHDVRGCPAALKPLAFVW